MERAQICDTHTRAAASSDPSFPARPCEPPDNTALNMDIVLSWTVNGVSYTVSPFIVAAGGATYNGNNINAIPRRNWETISWNNPASSPQAGTYHVCAVCNSDACGKTYTLTVSITGAAEGFIGALRTTRTGFTNPPNPYVCTATSPHRIVTYGRAPRNPPPPPFRGRSLLSQSPPLPSTADTIRGSDQDGLSS